MFKVFEDEVLTSQSSGETKKKFLVPTGLQELIADISKSVIKQKPEAIITYIADFLEAQLLVRKHIRECKGLIETHMYNVNEHLIEYNEYGITEDAAIDAATKIQAVFRGYQVRKRMGQILKKSATYQIIKNEQFQANLLKTNSNEEIPFLE